eukprot:6166338-Lingulodinium_polyedra.AAC.1
MEDLLGRGRAALAVAADVSKARRRYLHDPRDWGLMARQLRERRARLNCVGTFGMSPASYW